MKVITNNSYRKIIYGHELPDNAKEDFDYLDDIDNGCFFKYKGLYYDLGEFLVFDNDNELHVMGWGGFFGISYFNCIVVKYSPCNDLVIVGNVV